MARYPETRPVIDAETEDVSVSADPTESVRPAVTSTSDADVIDAEKSTFPSLDAVAASVDIALIAEAILRKTRADTLALDVADTAEDAWNIRTDDAETELVKASVADASK